MRGIRLYVHPSASEVKLPSSLRFAYRDDQAASTPTGEEDKRGASFCRPNAQLQRPGRATRAQVRWSVRFGGSPHPTEFADSSATGGLSFEPGKDLVVVGEAERVERSWIFVGYLGAASSEIDTEDLIAVLV
jgi:hypothetical protein